MKIPPQHFWVFSDGAGVGSKLGEERMWTLDLRIRGGRHIDMHLSERLKYDIGPLAEPIPEFVAEAKRPHDVEDVAFVYQSQLVVSERARGLIDEAGPSDCQYWPVDVFYKGKSLDLKYYLMHCNHTFECEEIAVKGSIYASDSQPTIYMGFTIDPIRIPSHISTFRVRNGMQKAIMRDSLRCTFKKHRVSGALFYTLNGLTQ